MKKVLVLLLSAGLFISCSSGPKLRISNSDMKKKYKRILVIPLYTSVEFIPEEVKQQRFFNIYSPKYKKQLKSIISKSTRSIDKEVKDILAKGLFKFQVVKYKGKIKKDLVKVKREALFNKLKWNNYYYDLTIPAIKKLAKQYKADAVLLHQLIYWKDKDVISSNTVRGYRSTTTYTTTAPRDAMIYITYLFSKEGKVLFTNNFKGNKKITWLQNYYRQNKVWMTRPNHPLIIKQDLSPEKTKYNLRSNTKYKRGYYKVFLVE